MKICKKTTAALLAIAVVFCLAACGGQDKQEETAPDNAAQTTDTAESSDTLVVYFSATGTTRGVAEIIAKVTGGDLYEIIPEEPYTDTDLDYNDSKSRATREQNDESVRPQIDGKDISLDSYTTIYIGYPIWWGQEPRIMDTFVENHDFGDKTVIPFCTSGSSNIDKSSSNLSEKAGSGKWLKGDRLEGSSSESDIKKWIAKFN